MSIQLNSSEALLARAMSELMKRWDGTAGEWRDKARMEFEQEYLEELQATVKSARQAMKAVDDLLRKAVRECS